jgi:NTP pyrophosphatase (non-canonical NTP hydrolase)
MLFDCFCRPVPQLNSGTDATTCKYPLTMPDSLNDLNRRLLAFARERDWEQFHSPKNLSMALAGECGELLEHFQWLTEAQSAALEDDKKEAVGQELADILIYLIRLAERLDIDLIAAAEAKIALNERRYPARRVRGDARRAEEYLALDDSTATQSVVDDLMKSS